MMSRNHVSAGFSFVELMLVISLMAILAAMIIPDSNPSAASQLSSAARVLEGDLAYCQSLSVTHNSTYQIRFDADGGRYYLEHTGTDSALDALPKTVFGDDQISTRRTMRFSDLPLIGSDVRVATVQSVAAGLPTVGDVEFGPLGETTRTDPTVIWLTVGQSGTRRYLALYVNATTGLTRVGGIVTAIPSSPEEVIQTVP